MKRTKKILLMVFVMLESRIRRHLMFIRREEVNQLLKLLRMEENCENQLMNISFQCLSRVPYAIHVHHVHFSLLIALYIFMLKINTMQYKKYSQKNRAHLLYLK